MEISKMNRAELEVAILEYEILPTNTAEELDTLSKMTETELRAAVQAWIEAAPETV